MKRRIFVLAVIIFAYLFIPTEAHAIIVLPAIILIPIVKIVAVIIGGLSIPAAIIGIAIAKVKNRSKKEVFLISLGILLLVGVAIAIIIRITNPDLPWV